MEARSMLLLNSSFILLISVSTDHWLLYRIRDHPQSPPGCSIHQRRRVIYVKCTNSSHVLLDEHASLFRQCNDLSRGERKNASRSNLLYSSPCHWFTISPSSPWRPSAVKFWKGVLSALLSSIALMSLAHGVHQCRKDIPDSGAKSLFISTFLFATTICMQLHTMHALNVEQPAYEWESLRYCEAGWSLGSAVVGTILNGIAAYRYLVQGRIRNERLRSQRRRRQLHNAMMSSCRQEIALAIRANMTVL